MYLSSGRNPLIWTVAYLLALCATGHPLHIREEGKEIPSGELGLFMESKLKRIPLLTLLFKLFSSQACGYGFPTQN